MELSPEEVASLPDGKSYSLAVFSMVQETNTQTPTHTHTVKKRSWRQFAFLYLARNRLSWPETKRKKRELHFPHLKCEQNESFKLRLRRKPFLSVTTTSRDQAWHEVDVALVSRHLPTDVNHPALNGVFGRKGTVSTGMSHRRGH